MIYKVIDDQVCKLIENLTPTNAIYERINHAHFVNRIAKKLKVGSPLVKKTIEDELPAMLSTRMVVWYLCDIYGSISSLAFIATAASKICGYRVSKETVCNYRLEYRHHNDLQEDCRTYATQTKRNMVKGQY